VLISCKCDTTPAERELDPVGIEARAKHAVKSLRAVQTSLTNPETFKMGLATLVRAVVTGGECSRHDSGRSNVLTNLQNNTLNTSLTPVDAPSRTQCDRSHLELLAYLHTLEQIRTILPAYIEIEDIHGMTRASLLRAQTTTSRCPVNPNL
jgi:hypothetical protein